MFEMYRSRPLKRHSSPGISAKIHETAILPLIASIAAPSPPSGHQGHLLLRDAELAGRVGVNGDAAIAARRCGDGEPDQFARLRIEMSGLGA